MLSLAIVALLLPSYPSSALPNVPEPILLAQHYEGINPYECIKYATIYLEKLEKNEDINDVTTSQKLYALNTLASCQITAEEISSAQKTLELISQIPAQNDSISEQIHILAEHNRQRIHMYELSQNSIRQRDSSHAATPEFRGPLQIENLKNYSYLMNAINSIHAGNFIEAGSTIDYINKSIKYNRSSDDNIWSMLYLTNSYLYQECEKQNRAFFYLGKLHKHYKNNKQDFYAAIIAREMALYLYHAGFYSQAIMKQRSFLKIIERIPELTTKYIRGIAELSIYELKAGNTSSSYSMLLKSELLLENEGIEINDLAFAYKQLGYAFKMNGDRPRAIKYLNAAAEIFKSEKSTNNYYDAIINLCEMYLASNQYDKAQEILNEIEDIVPILSTNNKILSAYLRAKFLASRRNYQQAYTTLKNVFEQKQNELFTSVKENNIPKSKTEPNILEQSLFVTDSKANNRFNSELAENMLTPFIDRSTYFMLVISLALLVFLLITYRRNNKYKKELYAYAENKTFYTNMELPGEKELISYLFSLNYNNKVENKKSSLPLPQEREIFNIFIPCFSKMAIEKGNDKTKQIERIIIDKILHTYDYASGKLFKIGNDRFVLIKNKDPNTDSQKSCDKLLKDIEQYLSEIHLSNTICIGGIEYPFLLNSTNELTELKLNELSILALCAANHITTETNKSSWVLFPSISLERKFNFSGDLREIATEAFERGILHYYVSHGRETLNWGELLKK